MPNPAPRRGTLQRMLQRMWSPNDEERAAILPTNPGDPTALPRAIATGGDPHPAGGADPQPIAPAPAAAPRAAAAATPAPAPAQAPGPRQQGRRTRGAARPNDAAATEALNNLSLDMARGAGGPRTDTGARLQGRMNEMNQGVAVPQQTMAYAKGGLVRHTPGWGFGKGATGSSGKSYAKGKR